jgi:hypothetical protein
MAYQVFLFDTELLDDLFNISGVVPLAAANDIFETGPRADSLRRRGREVCQTMIVALPCDADNGATLLLSLFRSFFGNLLSFLGGPLSLILSGDLLAPVVCRVANGQPICLHLVHKILALHWFIGAVKFELDRTVEGAFLASDLCFDKQAAAVHVFSQFCRNSFREMTNLRALHVQDLDGVSYFVSVYDG